jgi:integrase
MLAPSARIEGNPAAHLSRVRRRPSARRSSRPQPSTCLTCQKLRNPHPQALFHKAVQITFATELANANVSVYTLMKLLGHESMVTSQRYVDGAGTETRAASQLNPLYDLLKTQERHD